MALSQFDIIRGAKSGSETVPLYLHKQLTGLVFRFHGESILKSNNTLKASNDNAP